MSRQLNLSTIVTGEVSGQNYTLIEYLGSGGQGEVYRARSSQREAAIKWYFPHQAVQTQYEALKALIQFGAPTDRFLWPHEVVRSGASRGFGYAMPLREPRFKSITDLMLRRAEPGFRAVTTTGIELADSMLQLHSRGLCYRDISFGNLFFDPDSGEIRICDNDNVAINGAASPAVLGTARFMAPEIVRGESSASIETDLYSLAVLLFYLFMVHHPLDGGSESAIKCLDLPAMNLLYGERPVFIFDPEDSSNSPIPGHHDNAMLFWPLYPPAIQQLFVRSFTAGLRSPYARVRESEWRAALVRLRDTILVCKCGMESFLAPGGYVEGGQASTCWNCRSELRMPPVLRIGGNLLLLYPETRLYPHHTNPDRMYNFLEPTGIVVEDPSQRNNLLLRNSTTDIWRIAMPNGSVLSVGHGHTVPLNHGAILDFGRVTADVVCPTALSD